MRAVNQPGRDKNVKAVMRFYVVTAWKKVGQQTNHGVKRDIREVLYQDRILQTNETTALDYFVWKYQIAKDQWNNGSPRPPIVIRVEKERK